MVRSVAVGTALMLASGAVFAFFGIWGIVGFAVWSITGNPDLFLMGLILIAALWWLIPVAGILSIVGWALARGVSRTASLVLTFGGGVLAVMTIITMVLTNFDPLFFQAALLILIPSVAGTIAGAHSLTIASRLTPPGPFSSVIVSYDSPRRGLRPVTYQPAVHSLLQHQHHGRRRGLRNV